MMQPVEWNIATQKTYDDIKTLFKENDITDINLKFNPKP